MGADHKLDLTSDVTHLLVGDTDTPKYKYVAREREDVKVLRPEWIEAVREAYMADNGVDLNALEAEYRLPTFTGLTICITGFDDLALRAQLQQRIDEQGGKYTGDLTKHVTHLVAAKPEGKKYQYAMQWQKKIVALKWLEDSIGRTMQLDEAKYHPSLPPHQQGVGAWNKDAKISNHLGKRSRPQEPVAAEPSRKLRRTASAKLSTQTDGMWADISGNSNNNDTSEREPLRSSKSMPASRPEQAPGMPYQEPIRSQDREQIPDPGSRQPRVALLSHGYMDESYFYIDNFDARKAAILTKILLEEGGTVLDDLHTLFGLEHVSAERCFLIVPHATRITSATEAAKKSGRCQIVTEFWIEICMERKQCVDPHSYPLGSLLPRSSAFKGLCVNSSGFPGIERNHVAKVIQATGAMYDEVFKAGLSVMISNSASPNLEKMCHARKWKIPMVTVHWLWASLQAGVPVSFEEYAVDPENLHGRAEPGKKHPNKGESLTNEERMNEAARDKAPEHPAYDFPTQPLPKKVTEGKGRPGSDFLTEERAGHGEHIGHSPTRATEGTAKLIKPRHGTEVEQMLDRALPLQNSKGNSPPKVRSASAEKRKALFRTLDGASSLPGSKVDDQDSETVPRPPSASDQNPQSTELLNGAIKDLLNQRGRTKSSTSTATANQSNREPLSRALSNVSNVSRASRTRSVSSVNTDGLGSEIGMGSAEPGRAASSSRGRGNFKGRANPRDESQQATQKPSYIGLNDSGLFREDFAEEEIAPQQLTQLGYEDPEEAIALRAKLAEKRRKKTKAGQEDPTPEQRKDKAKPEMKRIRDDDALLDAKWAGGRRTRHKDRTPPELKGLNDF